MNGNLMTVVGNLTRDPELKYTRNDHAMCKFSVADNHGWRDGDGEWQTKTSFIDCVVWGKMAENIAETLSKADRVVVTGRIDQQTWEAEDGGKRSKLELEVEAVGPDLRFATAEVSRIESKGGKSKTKKSSSVQASDFDSDEEPF